MTFCLFSPVSVLPPHLCDSAPESCGRFGDEPRRFTLNLLGTDLKHRLREDWTLVCLT